LADLSDVPGLKARIARTRARLGRLAFMRAFGPALAFLLVYLCAALFGGLEQVSTVVAAGIGVSALLVLALLIVRGARRWTRPEPDAARDALDRQSSLRPIAGMADRPASATRDGQALWQAHTARLREAASELRVPGFWSQWRRVDPAYLRFILPALAIAALAVAGNQRADRLQPVIHQASPSHLQRRAHTVAAVMSAYDDMAHFGHLDGELQDREKVQIS